MATVLPELDELLRLIDAGGARFDARVACEVQGGLPVHVVALGSRAPDAPAAGFFGGVHGLERVGTQVLLSFLRSLLERLKCDEALEELLAATRLVLMPLVNPGGMSRRTRANPSGVDLMRNAPLESRERVPVLVGGQRLSPRLPWYRGAAGAPMEPESRALCEVVRRELLGRPFALALDCHSGFGLRDRLWFPHAHTRAPFRDVAEVHALVERFAAEAPEHPYLFEPQSRRYLAHGDLWDHLCGEARQVFLPLTLEMGSWRWIRKSPRQLWSRAGLFNPLPAERLARVRRNHLRLLDFLCRAAHEHRQWLPSGEARERHRRRAMVRWFA